MASLVRHSQEERRSDRPFPRAAEADHPTTTLDVVHERLSEGATDRIVPLLAAAHERARRTLEAAGGTEAADRLATTSYTGDVLVLLATEGDLEAADVELAVESLSSVRQEPGRAVRLDLLREASRHPSLHEIPPLVAGEIALRLLRDFGFVAGVSLWRRGHLGTIEPALAVGDAMTSRRIRATAKAALRRIPSLSLVGRASFRTECVQRHGEPAGVLVARVEARADASADEGLRTVASALTGVLERETLLERSAKRERALVGAGERRLMRLGFDLHDGPIQDVLGLAEEIRTLRDQLYPFVLDSQRELAYRRFDDLVARVATIDDQLRELAHSLESKSIISRPVGEVLHREVEAFSERTGIEADLEIRGDPESLTAAQRIAVFRAIQEALANAREHSGATAVEIRVRSRRTATSVRITDNGEGFDVAQSLSRAAQRGRLGVVGIGERVRMLGGTFSLDSAPGGPTVLTLTLPHWHAATPDDPASP